VGGDRADGVRRKPLRSVAKGALDLGDLADAEEKAAQEREATALKPLVERLAKALGNG